MNKHAIIISISSDIGLALAEHWLLQGWQITGTYRTYSSSLNTIREKASLLQCDLNDNQSITNLCKTIHEAKHKWDALIFATGSQQPVGKFIDCNFDEWKKGVEVNFLQQLRLVHSLLSSRNFLSQPCPCVLFFAGGGTNNAVPHYSSYTISKIALIKMCELLDAEIPDTRFVIVGPGWVKTKIHEETIAVGEKLAGNNYQKTIEKLKSDNCTPMSDVIACCDWLVTTDSHSVNGRNFSVVFDKWGSDQLLKKLSSDTNLYKLRRFGNH